MTRDLDSNAGFQVTAVKDLIRDYSQPDVTFDVDGVRIRRWFTEGPDGKLYMSYSFGADGNHQDAAQHVEATLFKEQALHNQQQGIPQPPGVFVNGDVITIVASNRAQTQGGE